MGFDEFFALVQERGEESILTILRELERRDEERERTAQPHALSNEEFESVKSFLVAEWKAGRIRKGRLMSLLRGAAHCLRSTEEHYIVRRQARQALLRLTPIDEASKSEDYRKALNMLREVAKPGRDVLEFIRFWQDMLRRAREC